MTSPRVVVIGLDGATWNLVQPWAEAGYLPTLQHLMQAGSWGTLQSTIQPLTAVAWSSFITGMNPGKHGIFDFNRRVPGQYAAELTNGGARHGRSLWRLLSEVGLRVGVVNVPMTYPPEQVNGFLVAGLDAPGLSSDYTYPPALRQHLAPDHAITVSTLGKSHARYLAETLALVDARFRVLNRLLAQEQSLDFLMKVIMETDAIQHCSWSYLSQPDHPAHSAIRQVYERIDRHLGQLVEHLGSETTLIVMSDHGAGPIECVVYLDRWLASQGWLRFNKPEAQGLKGRMRQIVQKGLAKSIGLAQQYLPPSAKTWARQVAGSRSGSAAEEFLRHGSIDWTQTAAYSWGNQGNINLNIVGRDPQGMIQPGIEAEAMIERLRAALFELRHPQTGQPLVAKVHRREEIYTGPYVHLAPDLLIEWVDDSTVSKLAYDEPEGSIFGHSIPFGRFAAPGALEQTGTHQMQGICLFYGQHVRAGSPLQGARLIDLAPTILYLLDVPLPADMDGRPLTEVLTSKHPPRFEGEHLAPQPESQDIASSYEPDDEQIVRERLQSLGYIA